MNTEKLNKKYIVVELTTDYNDEYYVIQDGYTLSSKIFLSKEKAKEEIDNQVKKLFMIGDKLVPSSFNFSYYLCDNDELVDYIKNLYKESQNDKFEENYLTLPDSATLEQCLKAYRLSDLELFQIIEVEEHEN